MNLSFLKGRGVIALNLLFVIQAAGFYAVFSPKEEAPTVEPLAKFPAVLGQWQLASDTRMDAESESILRPDDYIVRGYRSPSGDVASLFVAYFRSQTNGHAPHSPQNCLPGNGWGIRRRGTVAIDLPESQESISINRYIIAKDGEEALVLYWYHGPSKVIANEYRARFQLILDSVSYRRSDTALVRVIVPFTGANEGAAEKSAIEFAQVLHPALSRHIPLARTSTKMSTE